MLAPIIVTADHAQKRIKRDRLTTLAEGSYKAERGGRQTGWNLPISTGVYQDKITFTTFLMPTCFKPEWHTTTTGAYAKYAVGDLTFSDSAFWADTSVGGESLGWLKKPVCVDDYVYTPTLSNINQGMWVSRFGFGGADIAGRIMFECGWSDDGSREVALRFYSNGDVEVWKATELVGTGNIGIDKTEKWFGVMLLPFRRRELLIISESGEGFAHLFSDLPEDGTVQEITPATKFWVRIPKGTAVLQIAKVQFENSGTLYSGKKYFAEPPPTPAPTLDLEAIQDGSGYGSTSATVSLVETNISGAFVTDGIKDSAVIKVAMTGGPSATPFVYGAFAGYEQEQVETDSSEESDLVWQDLSITVADSPDGAKAQVLIRDPENAGVDRLTLLANRPIHIHTGGISLFDGRGGPPQINRGRIAGLDYMTLAVNDGWQALKNYRFQDRLPLDGLDWKVAVELMFLLSGWDSSQLDIEDPGLTLGLASSPTAGEWSVLIKEGDTAAQWVERLFEGFAGDWFYGVQPQATGMPKFFATSPTTLSDAVEVELFRLREDAVAQLVVEGYSADDAEKYAAQRTVRNYSETRVIPEATDIRVTGIDIRSNKYLQAKYIDLPAQDPTEPPSTRQDNWLGERSRFGYLEPMLTTQDLVDDAAAKLGDRLTRIRTLIDFETDFLIKSNGVPLWRGGVVRVDGDKKYRVRSFSMKSVKDIDDVGSDGMALNCWRPTSYTAELIDPNAPWAVSTGQVGGRAISMNQLRRLATQGLRFSDLFNGIVRLDR